MNWDAISGIAGVVSAIGVIFSLIYVAFQVKKNTIETRRANARSTAHDHATAIHAILGDAEVAEIILHGMENLESLNPVERYRFDLGTLVWLQAIEQAFADILQRHYPDDTLYTYRVMVPGVLNSPGGLAWWHQRKAWFSENSSIKMESLLSNPPEETAQTGVRPWPSSS